MSNFKQFVEPFQQLGSTRGGKVLTIILLAFAAILASIVALLQLGTLDPLEGVWKNAFNISVVLFFLLLALAIYFVIKQDSVKTKEKMANTKRENKEGRKTVETDRLHIWSHRVVLIGLLIMAVVIYAFGWMLIIRDLIIPTIQDMVGAPFDWSVKSLTNNIVLPLLMVIMWVVMPFLMYLEMNKKRLR